MKRFIVNPDNNEELIAEIVGPSSISIVKRLTDKNPVKVLIKGQNWDVAASGTLSGKTFLIECVDGKINEEDLSIAERNDDGTKPQPPKPADDTES